MVDAVFIFEGAHTPFTSKNKFINDCLGKLIEFLRLEAFPFALWAVALASEPLFDTYSTIEFFTVRTGTRFLGHVMADDTAEGWGERLRH